MKEIIATLAAERGVTAEALRKWRERGYVPPKYHLPLLGAAKQKGIQLNERDFEFQAAEPKRRRAA